MNKLLSVLIWLFPVAAIGISGYLAKRYFDERGPEITIEFSDAANIEPNRTKVVYRGIVVGRVERTMLDTEDDKALAVVRMASEASHLLRKDTRFLIVQPEVTMEGITGLETLVKGAAIRLEPGKGEPATHFVGIETSQAGMTERDVTKYQVVTAHADSLGPGDPIYFRGTKIGSVTDARLDKEARGVVLDVAVYNRFRRVIRANTVFWRKSAVQADLGLFGSNIEIGSLEAMMKGGINIATPSPAGKLADAGGTFSLLPKEPEDWREWAPALTL